MLAKEQLAADGFPTWVIQTVPDFDALPGPFRTAALIVDPRAGLRIRPASGDGQRMRRMRTSEIARRTGALAATNGGFFSTSGDPLGCLMVAGEVFSEPDPQRTCAGFTDDGVILFDRCILKPASRPPPATSPSTASTGTAAPTSCSSISRRSIRARTPTRSARKPSSVAAL